MSIKYQKTLTQSWKTIISLAQTIGGTKTGKKLAKNWSGKMALILAGTAATATPAHGLRINATYSSEIDLATKQIIEDTFGIWEDQLKDPVTLNINFSFSDTLPTGILGGSKPAMVKVNYKDYLTALTQDALSNDDWITVKRKLAGLGMKSQFNNYLEGSIQRREVTLDTTKTFDLLINSEFNNSNSTTIATISPIKGQPTFLDNNNNNNNQTIWLTSGNAKALGLVASDNVTSSERPLDASIVFSDGVNWDMDSSDGINANAYDFRTVVLHEVGHALGFVSGTDAIEYLNSNSNEKLSDHQLTYVTPINTYTYSAESKGLGVIDLRLGQGIEKYISFDGGETPLTNNRGDMALLSTGGTSVGGDGYQTSHWKNSTSALGIMTPTLAMGESLSISTLDLRLLDVTGWELSHRSRQLMSQVGLDWDAFQEALEKNHQTVLDTAAADWQSVNPGESIREQLDAELWALYQDIELDISNKLLNLKNYFATETDPSKRQQEIDKVDAEIWDLIDKQDQQLKNLANQMKDVTITVRKWLAQDIATLADLLRNANRVQIYKLQMTLENATEKERTLWEDKLKQAFALFLENPDQALARINATNDFHNPMDGGSGGSGSGGGWWGGWWSSSVENSQDFNLYNYSAAPSPNNVQPTQSVPEPSAIIALVALGGMGFLTRQG